MTTPAEIYTQFIKFEEGAADLYLTLSVRFMHQPDLSWFWVEMAMEEKQHAGLLQFCRESQLFSSKLPEASLIDSLRKFFDQLGKQASDPNLTIDEAFDIAVRLETSEINSIYNTLTAGIDGPWYILQKKIDSSTFHHIRHLAEGARQFGAHPAVISPLIAEK